MLVGELEEGICRNLDRCLIEISSFRIIERVIKEYENFIL